MFNPHDALPLPPHPSLEQYKKRAKDLLKAARDAEPAALRTWASTWIEMLVQLSGLTLTPQLPVRMDDWTNALETFAHEKLSDNATLTAAQFVIARSHGFESWPRLAHYIESMARTNSPVNNFELAVDAIIAGDLTGLKTLLRDHPDLIHSRSTRRHQATLLHYVGANGVEGYRQKTPPNIVAITAALLKAGAEVSAIAQIYAGSTTLLLVATSAHPERAGVQEPLLELLLDHGATFDEGLLTACLANGRLKSAEFLAQRGAPIDLEAAAGLGRGDIVQSLIAIASSTQLERALLWASEYGRNSIVDFLLERGVPIQSQAGTGQTALHWAVIGGHPETIALLLRRGADLEAKNVFGATPLGQAQWSALHADTKFDYPKIAALLKQHGAKE